MEENKKGSNRIYIAIIVALLLIDGVVGYLLYKENKQKQEKIEEVNKYASDYKELNEQFETAKVELESLKGKNTELDSIIQERQAKIEKYQAQLAEAQRTGKLTAAELKQYKVAIAQLQEENTTLQKRVAELTSQNQELTSQNLALDKYLIEEKATTAALTSEKEHLSKKVELGSLLQLQNVKVEGVARKSSGKEATKHYLKNVDYLKISFATGENKVLEAGPLELYVRVLNPKREAITSTTENSGMLQLSDGSSVQYSKKVVTEWQKVNKNVVVEWGQNLTEKGSYKVEVYQLGHLIGQSSVELK